MIDKFIGWLLIIALMLILVVTLMFTAMISVKYENAKALMKQSEFADVILIGAPGKCLNFSAKDRESNIVTGQVCVDKPPFVRIHKSE